jgi:hypothetical protein
VVLAGGSTLHNNTAVMGGGGIFAVYGATVALTDRSSVYSNKVLRGSGGGLSLLSNVQVVISDQSSVANNTCFNGSGGGIGVNFGVFATFDARGRLVAPEQCGGSSEQPSQITINNSTISNNTSARSAGGGLAVSGGSIVELINGTVVVQQCGVQQQSCQQLRGWRGVGFQQHTPC